MMAELHVLCNEVKPSIHYKYERNQLVVESKASNLEFRV